MGGDFSFLKDRKSVIWGVWAAPGAPETLAKGGERPERRWRRDGVNFCSGGRSLRVPICSNLCLAVLKAKIKIKNPRIRAGIGPKPAISH